MNKKYKFCCPYCGGSRIIRKSVKTLVSNAHVKCFEEANDGYMYSLDAASVDGEGRESSSVYVCDGCLHEWDDIDELRECGAVVACTGEAASRGTRAFSIARGNANLAADCVGDISKEFTADNTYFIYTDAVNIHGAAGGGLARAYADKYPNMDDAYVDWCHSIEIDRYAYKTSGGVPQAALTQTVLCDLPGMEDMWDEYKTEWVEDGFEEVTIPYSGRYMGMYSGSGKFNDDLCLNGDPDDVEAAMSEAAERSACGYPDESDWWDDFDGGLPEGGLDAPAKVYKPSVPHPSAAKQRQPWDTVGKVGAQRAQVPAIPRKIKRPKYRMEQTLIRKGTTHQAMFIMNTMPAVEYGIRTSYEAIVASLEGFAHTRYRYSNSEDQVHKVLVIPAVGCGIGGCAWEVVRPLLEYYASIIVANRSVTQIDHVIIVEPSCKDTNMETLEIVQ